MSSKFAAIDVGNTTGAVYGIGNTPEEARADALENGADGAVQVVPCSNEAAAYVAEYGGAPGRRLAVTPYGVTLED